MNESKKAIYDLIPPQFYPKTELVNKQVSFPEIEKMIANSGIQYPLIAKPDIGLRGSAVQKIDRVSQLKTYHDKADFDYVIQDLIPFPNEIGIFYVRYPHEKTGRITGIVAKEFLIVTGDGKSTIEQLVKQNPRYELQLKALKREYANALSDVPKIGEKINLVPYGNHARGAKFIDGSAWITAELTKIIDDICIQVPDFYFGRLDLMYSTLEELERGENFSIVELNGAASEPTHIYDPKHSIFFAWKELSRHIRYMYGISAANHKNGAPYLPYKIGMREYREHLKQSNKILHF
jgi:hypothetical protein